MISFEKELNPQQLAVVTEGNGPCLVLAGAGSGKTRTATYRVAYLLAKGIKPENIMLLTFTNRAAKEMIARVESLSGSANTKGLWAGTFHAIANRVLRHNAALLGYKPNFSVLDEDDAETLIKSCIKELGYEANTKRSPSAHLIKTWHSFATNAQLSLREVLEMKAPHLAAVADQVEEIVARYVLRKKEANAMDFDDLLTKWLELLDQPDFKDKFARQFKYVLVDEYQDTNKIQSAIVKHLASVHGNLLVVGDDAQSIYSFRAADINNILQFEKDYPQAKIYRLEINYRSTPDILNLANHVISQNQRQYQKILTSPLKAKVKPTVIQTNTPNEEAEVIISRIMELKLAGHKLKNMAVLFRAAFHAQVLEMELNRHGLPYDFRGGLRFFDRAHVKDVLAFLRLMDNPRDMIAWLRVLENFQGIGPNTAKAIIAQAQTISELKDIIMQDFSAVLNKLSTRGWEDFKSLLGSMLKTKAQKPGELLDAIAESVYADYLKDKYENAEDRIEDIRQLASFAGQQKSLTAFLSDVSLDESYGDKNKDERDRLVLSTVHQAKGLEWEAVFLINLVAGAFPNERAMNEPGGEEEERRLFYVGITRAKSHLCLTYPMISARFEYNRPSDFVTALKRDLVDHKEEHNDWISQGEGESAEEPAIEVDKAGNPASSAGRLVKKRPKEFLKRIEDL